MRRPPRNSRVGIRKEKHIIYCGLLSFYEFMALLSPHITDNISSFISFSEADGRATDLGHQVLVRKEP